MKRLATILLSLLPFGCSHATRTPRAAAPGTPQLKLLTYNVNYGLAGDKPGLDAIDDADADVVFLQETTSRWETAIRDRFGEKYPYMTFHESPGAGGLAVLSRAPFEEKDYIASPTGWFPALRVIVDSPLGKVQVLTVHLHPMVTDDGSFVRGYLSTGGLRTSEMGEYVKTLDPDLPTLVVGDFNENAKGGAVAILTERGFRTALPEFAPGAKTWHWNTSVGELRQQLDHVAYDTRLEPLDVRVMKEGRSDHDPVLATFVVRPDLESIPNAAKPRGSLD